MAVAAAATAILDFWFHELTDKQRFARDAEIDATIRARFGALHAQLAAGVPDAWLATPQTRRAAIIVFDQFSRNLYRDDPRAFAQDAAARDLTCTALAAGDDAGLSVSEREFLYMPMMHSEAMADQQESLRLFGSLGDPEIMRFALSHHDTVARFGRFPARNAALERTSSDAEVSFLAAHPAGF